MKVSVIITAAGSSSRMGGIKKEFLPVKNNSNSTVLSCCVNVFCKTFFSQNQKISKNQIELNSIVITLPEGKIEDGKNAIFSDSSLCKFNDFLQKNIFFTEGSQTRQKSVFNALKFLSDFSDKNKIPDIVLIHDGARPFVSEKIISDVVFASIEYGAAIPGIFPVDTQKEIDDEGFVTRHLERQKLKAVQTPQGFDFNKILTAHKNCDDSKIYTDDSEIYAEFFGKVKVVEGDVLNKKITFLGDL